MKTCVLFNTSQLFDTHPDYEGDSVEISPPGRLISNSLIQHLKDSGISIDFEEIPHDCWEHSNWYFWGSSDEQKYNFIVQTNCSFEPPLRCYVGVSKRVGFLEGIFSKSDKALDVPETLIDSIVQFAMAVSDEGDYIMLDEKEAADEIWAS